MKSIVLLLLFFLGVGLFVRRYNARTSLLLITVIVCSLLYLYIT